MDLRYIRLHLLKSWVVGLAFIVAICLEGSTVNYWSSRELCSNIH